MKKMIVFILSLLCLMASGMTVNADNYDCLFGISNDESESLRIEETDVIIKYYGAKMFMKEFAENSTIDNIIDESPIFYVVWSEKDPDNPKYLRNKNGEIITGFTGVDHSFLLNHTLGAEELLRSKVTFDFEIKNIYFLYGGNDGIYIYYVTSVGDYVYYKLHEKAEKEYVFPIEKFLEFAKEAVISVPEGHYIGSHDASTALKKFSKYEVGYTKAFTMQCITSLMIAVVILVSLYAFTKLHIKKKRKI